MHYVKNVNAATIKGHFPLPFMKHVLESIARAETYSILDGFRRCNQIQIAREEIHKTNLTTQWGIFA